MPNKVQGPSKQHPHAHQSQQHARWEHDQQSRQSAPKHPHTTLASPQSPPKNPHAYNGQCSQESSEHTQNTNSNRVSSASRRVNTATADNRGTSRNASVTGRRKLQMIPRAPQAGISNTTRVQDSSGRETSVIAAVGIKDLGTRKLSAGDWGGGAHHMGTEVVTNVSAGRRVRKRTYSHQCAHGGAS